MTEPPRISTLLFKIGATAAFPLLALSAALSPSAQSQWVFVLFLASLALMIQLFIVIIWTDL